MHIFVKKTTHSYRKNAKLSYIAYALIHFYKELAIEMMSLLNRLGCMVTWVTWVRGLHGSNFYMGWVGYVGQKMFYLGHNFFVDEIDFCVGLCVVHNFCVFFFFFFFTWISLYLLDEIIFYTATNSLGIFFGSLFPANLDQTLFAPFGIFEWLDKNLQNRWDSMIFLWTCD